MLIDLQSLLLDPNYDIWGLDAVLTDKFGSSRPVRILDHRTGQNVVAARGSQTVLVPGVAQDAAVIFIRHSQCPAKPTGCRLQIDGESMVYEIRNSLQKGNPQAGEWICELSEV